MLVGDLVWNSDFDCNCEFEVYDCTEDETCWNDGAECIFSSKRDGWHKPVDEILDMKIKYVTIHSNVIIIEAGR